MELLHRLLRLPLLLAVCTTPWIHAQEQGVVFEEKAEATGLEFEHFIGATGDLYLPEIMGSGVGLLDYDLDGDLDVYLVQGTRLNPDKPLAERIQAWRGNQPPVNRLFRNDLYSSGSKEKGVLRFTDVTEEAGAGHPGYGMGITTADYDGDGDWDFYLTNFGPNVLYRNNGNGTFSDVTEESGTGDSRWSTGATFFDYDRDGDLDLFVLNYVDFTVKGNKICYDAVGALDYCNPKLYRPLPDRLFQNQGNGKFTDVTEASGVGAAIGPSLGVSVGDFNRDGRLDIYVANDGAANYLWVNNGDGTFLEDALMAGAAFNADGAPQGSMGLAVADFDDDGDEDLFMTHLRMETNTLYTNDGEGNFHDDTTRFGLADMSYPYTSFGTRWFDYDNDSLLDLFIANGAVYNLEALRGDPYPYHQTNQLIHNQGNGKFQDVSQHSGPCFQLSEVSRGVAVGDLDEDGDLDIVASNNRGPVRLLINEAGSRNPRLSVSLRSKGANRYGLGAEIELRTRTGQRHYRRVGTDGSYLSASDVRAHFGLGFSGQADRIIVLWPDGSRESWSDLPTGSELILTQGSGGPGVP